MKKLIFGFLAALPLTGWAQKSALQLKGTITGLADKSKIYLINPDQPGDTLARAVSKQNSFALSASLPDTKLYSLVFLPGGKKAMLFLENGIVTLTGDLAKPQQLTVKGSPAHASFLDFQKQFDPYFKHYAQLSEIANKSGVTDSLLGQYKGLVQEIMEAGTGFSESHKTDNIAPFMWATILSVVDDINVVDKSYQQLTPAVQNSFYGKYLADRIADKKIGAIGTQAIDFVQTDTSGKPVALSSFRGKYVLIDFWASWCGPCRQENPNVVAAFNRFHDKNFTVLGVSLDNNRDRWLKAIADDQLSWTHVSDLQYWQNEVALKYRIQNIPQNLLLDPNGVIIAKNLRGEVLEQKLCEILGCN